jgi:hypothetical protein
VINEIILPRMWRWSASVSAAAVAAVALATCSLPAAAAYGHSQGDRVVFGSSVVIPAGDEVKGDLVVMAGSAEVHGTVDGDAVVMAGSLYIAPEGVVKGETVALGGSVDNESSYKKSGGATPISPLSPMPIITPIVLPPMHPVPDDSASSDYSGYSAKRDWIEVLITFGVLTLLAFALFPARTRLTLDHLLHRPALAGVLGLTWPFTLSIITVGLAITVLGIVLIPVAVVAAALGYLVGRAALSMYLGRQFFEFSKVAEPSPIASIGLGLLIITVLEGIAPLWLGIVLEAIVSALAIGSAMLPLLNRQGWPHPTFSAPPPAGTQMNPPPGPIYAPPTAPPPSGPPAIP